MNFPVELLSSFDSMTGEVLTDLFTAQISPEPDNKTATDLFTAQISPEPDSKTATDLFTDQISPEPDNKTATILFAKEPSYFDEHININYADINSPPAL